MKKVIAVLVLVALSSTTQAESLADKLKKKLDKALGSGQSATQNPLEDQKNKSVGGEQTDTNGKLENVIENLKDVCVKRNVAKTSQEVVDFLKFFKALPNINHDVVAKQISEDPQYACKTFYLCMWVNYPMYPSMFRSAYDRFKEDGTIGQCPWSIQKLDDLNVIIDHQQTLSLDLKNSKKEFELFSTIASKEKQNEQRLPDSKKKGEKIAADSKFKWDLETTVDPLSRNSLSKALNVTKVGAGRVETEVKCREGDWTGYIWVTMTFHGVKVPIGSKDRLPVKSRVNDNQSPTFIMQSDEFSNVFLPANILTWTVKNGLLYTDAPKENVYDYGVVIPTTGGDAYIEIPPCNQSIKKLLAQCAR